MLAAGGALPTTGRRNISSLMVNASSGQAYVQRAGSFVHLMLYGVVVAGPVSNSIVRVFESGFPAGFRPPSAMVFPLATTAPLETGRVARTYLDPGGRLDINNPGQAVYGSATYLTTDTWPSSLPGSAA